MRIRFYRVVKKGITQAKPNISFIIKIQIIKFFWELISNFGVIILNNLAMKNSAIKYLTIIFLLVGVGACAQESVISKDELPQVAQTFISDNFANSSIDYIKKDKEILSTDYQVRFTDGVKIEFDSKGNWVEIDGNKNAIPTSFIQSNIVNYVKEKFPNAQIKKIEIGRFGKQEVKLTNGLELEFDSKGKFKKIDD